MRVSLIRRYSSFMLRGKLLLYNATHAPMFTSRLLLPLSSWTYRVRSFCVFSHSKCLFLLFQVAVIRSAENKLRTRSCTCHFQRLTLLLSAVSSEITRFHKPRRRGLCVPSILAIPRPNGYPCCTRCLRGLLNELVSIQAVWMKVFVFLLVIRSFTPSPHLLKILVCFC